MHGLVESVSRDPIVLGPHAAAVGDVLDELAERSARVQAPVFVLANQCVHFSAPADGVQEGTAEPGEVPLRGAR